MAVDSKRKFDSDSSTAYDVNKNKNSSTAYENDSDSDSITIVPHSIPGKPNVVFMKATLLHTKGEDNNLRMYATLASPVSHLPSLICLYRERH